jgi:hypothetical protein
MRHESDAFSLFSCSWSTPLFPKTGPRAHRRRGIVDSATIRISRNTAIMKPLWHCPRCRRSFANRNQSHACATHDLDHHFVGKDAQIRSIYDEFLRVIRSIGPVKVLPEKTRIAFQVRMSFAQLTPRTRWVDGHLILARRVESPVFVKVETFSPRNHLHAFRLTGPNDIGKDLKTLMREAYKVGAQAHLRGHRCGS